MAQARAPEPTWVDRIFGPLFGELGRFLATAAGASVVLFVAVLFGMLELNLWTTLYVPVIAGALTAWVGPAVWNRLSG